MPAAAGFPIFDADNHLYETSEALTRHLPKQYAGAIDYVDVHGRTKIVVRGQISDYIPNPTFDRVGRPGAQEEYFKIGNPEGKSYREIIGRGIDCPPAFRAAGPRLSLMDEQGVDFALMLPTLASLVEERMRDDPDLCAAVIHGLNVWMTEEWPFVYENRIFSTPVITPGVVDKAVEELEYVLGHGARVILMRPAPAWGYRGPRSFALPEFDPFWSRVEESGILTVIHASDSGYTRYTNEWEGSGVEMQAFAQGCPEFELNFRQPQRGLSGPHRGAHRSPLADRADRLSGAAVKDQLGGAGRPQFPGPGLVADPAQRLDHVRLAAAVWPDDAGQPGPDLHGRRLGEAFEPGDAQASEADGQAIPPTDVTQR